MSRGVLLQRRGLQRLGESNHNIRMLCTNTWYNTPMSLGASCKTWEWLEIVIQALNIPLTQKTNLEYF